MYPIDLEVSKNILNNFNDVSPNLINHLELLSSSPNSSNYIAHPHNKKASLVLKEISNSSLMQAKLLNEIIVLTSHIKRPKYILTKDNKYFYEYKNKFFFVYEFINGEHFQAKTHSLESISSELKLLNDAIAPLNYPERSSHYSYPPKINISKFVKNYPEYELYIQDNFSKYDEIKKNHKNYKPHTQFIDLHEKNCLFDFNSKALLSIIDIDSIASLPLNQSVGFTLIRLCLNRDDVLTFIKNYFKNQPSKIKIEKIIQLGQIECFSRLFYIINSYASNNEILWLGEFEKQVSFIKKGEKLIQTL